MKASFRVSNKRYINFDITSDEFEALDINEDKKADIIKNAQNESTIVKRQAAYKAESDPLYMEAQFDGTPESLQVWQDKVAEIKARYPLPENA